MLKRLSFKAVLFLGVFETLDSVGHLEKSSGLFWVTNWPCWTVRLMRFAQEVDMVPRLPRLNTFQLEGQFCVLRCAVLHGFSWVTTYGMLILLLSNCDFCCFLFLLLDGWVWWTFRCTAAFCVGFWPTPQHLRLPPWASFHWDKGKDQRPLPWWNRMSLILMCRAWTVLHGFGN